MKGRVNPRPCLRQSIRGSFLFYKWNAPSHLYSTPFPQQINLHQKTPPQIGWRFLNQALIWLQNVSLWF